MLSSSVDMFILMFHCCVDLFSGFDPGRFSRGSKIIFVYSKCFSIFLSYYSRRRYLVPLKIEFTSKKDVGLLNIPSNMVMRVLIVYADNRFIPFTSNSNRTVCVTVVPVYAFGENKTYSNLQGFYDLRLWLNEYAGY